jgi:tyrosine-protein phosphatase SIW14
VKHLLIMKRSISFTAIIAIFSFAFINYGWADSGSVKPADPAARISDFGKINENYYRGSQPGAEDIAALKAIGVRTVIDLRSGEYDEEKSLVRDAGMNYFNIPLSTTSPATKEETAEFLRLVNDPQNQPVYVHCKAGKHRTGGMTAIYRITHDNWTADQAYREMKRFGFYSFPNHGSWKKYIYRFYSEQKTNVQTADPAQRSVAPAIQGAN